MSNKQIVNLDYLDREAQLFKTAKNSIEENSKIIRETIDKNTTQEVEAVQAAINNLNAKVEQIMKTDMIKEKTNIIEKSEEQMIKSTRVASETFFKVKKIIHEKPELTQEQKREYEKKLFDKILDKFMTKEEKIMFTNLINKQPVFRMGNVPQIMNGPRPF